jgi:hypothetical protein
MGEADRCAWQAGEIDVDPDVAIDQQERIVAEQWQGIPHAAAGFQRGVAFVRVDDAQAPVRPIAQRGRELIRQPGDVDHDIVHADRGELFEMPFDEALAADFKQRFRAWCRSAGACARPGRRRR